MSAKDVRTDRLQKTKTVEKLVVKTCASPDAILRTLQRRERELGTIWTEYDEAHNKALVREKDDDLKADLEAEHDLVVEEHDKVLNLLEDKIDGIQERDYGPAPRDLTSKEKLDVIEVQYEATLAEATKRIRKLETSWMEIEAPTNAQIYKVSESLNKLKDEALEKIKLFYNQTILLLKPEELPRAAQIHQDRLAEVMTNADALEGDILQKMPEDASFQAISSAATQAQVD